ncbi:MAG TPA: flagellar biosynthetic protein FliR, partial [Thalassospira sp.]|nr:flagellar biosynthetic protein FliR [Thalassospira sp.]
IQIALALLLLTLALPSMMMVYLGYFENGLEAFLNP